MDPNCTTDNCPICLDPMAVVNENYKLNCNHTFHKECLQRWLETKNICPMCRTNVEPDLRYVDDKILSEAKRLHIENMRRYAMFIGRGLEFLAPNSLQGFSAAMTNIINSNFTTQLLEQDAQENTGSLASERFRNDIITLLEDFSL